MISRMLSQAKKIMLLASKKINSNLFRNRSRTARRISRKIDSWSKMSNSSGQQRRKYERKRDFQQARRWHNGGEHVTFVVSRNA